MSQKPELSIGTKIGWGFADAGINVFVFLKSVVILAYMTQYMGVSAAVAGWVIFAVVISDMVTDPSWGPYRTAPFPLWPPPSFYDYWCRADVSCSPTSCSFLCGHQSCPVGADFLCLGLHWLYHGGGALWGHGDRFDRFQKRTRP